MISVIICTFNRADLLADVLGTVCSQSLAPSEFEVIVVDNNSTDDTQSVTESFIQKHPNVRYCLETQQGLSHARNRGWHEAKGEYVAYIDDDCKVPPQWLEIATEVIATERPIEFGGPFYAFYNSPKPSWWQDKYDQVYSREYGDEHGYLAPHQEIFGGNLFLERKTLQQVGGFNPALGMQGTEIGYGEESDLHVRLGQAFFGHCAYYEPRLFVYHLVRAEKLSIQWYIQSQIAHGRYYYLVFGKGPTSLTRWKFILYPAYLVFVFTQHLFRCFFFRDRAQFPSWQNYLYEKADLHYYCRQLGVWHAQFLAGFQRNIGFKHNAH